MAREGVFSLHPLIGEEVKEHPWASTIRVLILFMGSLSHDLVTSPKVPTPHAIPLGVKISTSEFWGDISTQIGVYEK